MRITIDTDDKGKVSIDTGQKGEYTPGLFESTSDVPVIDAGPAPLQEIERQQKGMSAEEVSSFTASASPEERETEMPLNPLRAGAAAAYREPGNLRKKGVEAETSFAAQGASTTAIDGGSAKIPKEKEKESPDTPGRQ